LPAAALQAGDEIRNAEWATGTVEAIEFVAESQTMYNFTVATAHTYFVGNGQWLVHNACPTWPNTPKEMDDLMGFPGERIPDGPTTPGRDKVIWQPSDNIKITYEAHPYHSTAPDFHRLPHWHLDYPGKSHLRFLPGDPMPW
jgi:hypothetical protein